jgi:hypothetical protein
MLSWIASNISMVIRFGRFAVDVAVRQGIGLG